MRFQFWRRWSSGFTAVLTGAAAAALLASSGSTHGWAKAAMVTGGVVATLLTGLVTLVERRSLARDARAVAKLAEEAEAQLRLAFGDSLLPLVHALGGMHRTQAGEAKERLRGVAEAALLQASTQLIKGDRVRACYFKLRDADAAQPRRLVPGLWSGRAPSPRHVFTEGSLDGDAVLAMLDHQQRRFHRDVHTDPPPGWEGTTSGYRTFVSVPVVAGERCYGMFTVDTLQPGDLDDEEEVGLIDLLADLLAAVLSA